MFYVTDKKDRVIDTSGRTVGFLYGEKFRFESTVDSKVVRADYPYNLGLSPVELEFVSEAIQRMNRKRGCKHA